MGARSRSKAGTNVKAKAGSKARSIVNRRSSVKAGIRRSSRSGARTRGLVGPSDTSWLGGSVYIIEGGSTVGFIALLDRARKA